MPAFDDNFEFDWDALGLGDDDEIEVDPDFNIENCPSTPAERDAWFKRFFDKACVFTVAGRLSQFMTLERLAQLSPRAHAQLGAILELAAKPRLSPAELEFFVRLDSVINPRHRDHGSRS